MEDKGQGKQDQTRRARKLMVSGPHKELSFIKEDTHPYMTDPIQTIGYSGYISHMRSRLEKTNPPTDPLQQGDQYLTT